MITTHEFILVKAWRNVIKSYTNGNTILKNEKDLGVEFIEQCQKISQQENIKLEIGNQRQLFGKIVDVWLKDRDLTSVVELKLFHDRADWKESSTMKNTVESDLKFASGNPNAWVGIIDTIPSTSKHNVPFQIKWNFFKIDNKAFEERYKNISPPSSDPREQTQREFFMNGLNL